MLKLIYTETSFHLERLTQPVEDWVTQRVILALRVGQSIYVEPSTASFLLPANLPGVDLLKAEVKRDNSEIIAITVCDSEYIEVSLSGSWLAVGIDSQEGVFVTAISDSPLSDRSNSRTEFFLEKLWQEAHKSASVVIE